MTVLFVDDEAHLRLSAAQSFDLAEIEVTCLDSAPAALQRLSPEFPGVLVSDIRMPQMDGVTLMAQALKIDPQLPVILLTGHGDVDLAVRCMKSGAYDFLEKPFAPARMVECVRRALAQRTLTLENRALRTRLSSANAIDARLIGRSQPMAVLRKALRAVAATEADVLITGETGTGKEVAARALHAASARGHGPFVHINCAALPASLVESELFGHEAGAFPGATRARYGKFEHARGGILCLDEVDSLSPALQAKLLDVLHNRTVTRLGSNDPTPLDIRVVAIAKGRLEDAVAAGRFRADLLYRLNVVTLDMPPLSARREDIPALFAALVASAAERHRVSAPDIPPPLLGAVSAQDWPGNVRELRNAAERFVLGLPRTAETEAAPTLLAEQMAAHERALISAAIAAHGGRLKATYEALGLSRKTLYDKMQKHGLAREDYVDPEDG